MKTVLKFIGYFFIMLSPFICIFHLFVSMLTYEYIAQVNDENIEMMKEKLLINGFEVNGKLKEVQLHGIDWDEVEFVIVYENNETDRYIVTEDEESQVLSSYIIECSGKNDMLGLRFAIIGISIIASIVTFCRLNRTEIIYE